LASTTGRPAQHRQHRGEGIGFSEWGEIAMAGELPDWCKANKPFEEEPAEQAR